MDTRLTFSDAGFRSTVFILCPDQQELGEMSRQLPSLLNTERHLDFSLKHKAWAWKCSLFFPECCEAP